MGRPIVRFEIIGRDAPRLQAFYRDLFDWKIDAAGGAETGFYGMVDGDSSTVAGGIGQSPSGETRLTVYVQVPDLVEAIENAAKLGGDVALPPTQVPGGPRLAQIQDPDGNLIGLIEG